MGTIHVTARRVFSSALAKERNAWPLKIANIAAIKSCLTTFFDYLVVPNEQLNNLLCLAGGYTTPFGSLPNSSQGCALRDSKMTSYVTIAEAELSWATGIDQRSFLPAQLRRSSLDHQELPHGVAVAFDLESRPFTKWNLLPLRTTLHGPGVIRTTITT